MDALREPTSAISYIVSRQLSEFFPELASIECSSSGFDLFEYAGDGLCEVAKSEKVFSEMVTHWYGLGYGTWESPGNSWFDVDWQGHHLGVLLLSWESRQSSGRGTWILAETKEIATSFLIAVCEWCTEIRGEILVFEGGCWQKSKDLYESIQAASFDNLILSPEIKKEIQEDFRQFFAARPEYERYRIPWKRGVLFHGPPGNGKTHTLKALVNWLEQPCLYVKSFKSPYESDHEMIRRVFSRARQTTPCLLLLEDLDSLINDENRSYFLNELDGFAANMGIVVLATTNHPEKLDPAIVDRPSRFDRKYAFPLPNTEERQAYLHLWNQKAEPEIRVSENGLAAIAKDTDGFSFAYLKELWLSSLMRWISVKKAGTMDDIMVAQAALLKLQMTTPISESAPEPD